MKRLVVGALSLGALAACGGGAPEPCSPRHEGCACDPAAACDDPLVCVGGVCGSPVCGDGVVSAATGEQCDLGGGNDGVECSPTCQRPRCGDGSVQGSEECDDANTTDTDSCTTSCTTARCGDGFVHPAAEDCDDGNDLDTDACLTSCSLAACGDGSLHLGVEECDDGNRNDGDGCDADCGRRLWTAVVPDSDALGLDVDAEGNAVVCGTRVVAKVDPDGRILWVKERPALGIFPWSVVTEANGDILVAGGGDDGFLRVQRLDPDGDPLWHDDVILEGARDTGWGSRVALDPSGGFVVSGNNMMDPTTLWLRSYDDEDRVRWTNHWTGDGLARALAVTEGGRVVVAGATWGRSWIRAFERDGADAWSTELDAYAIFDIEIDPAGVIIAFGSAGEIGQDAWTARIDETGARLDGLVNVGPEGKIEDASFAPDGSLALTGFVDGPLGDRAAWTRTIGSDGRERATRIFDGSGSGRGDALLGTDMGGGVFLDESGRATIAATVGNRAGFDLWVRAYPP